MKEFKVFSHFSPAQKKCGGNPASRVRECSAVSGEDETGDALSAACAAPAPVAAAAGVGERAEAEAAEGAAVQKSVGIPVMDVPVLFSDKFLQSKESDLIVPQIQFISRVWSILVVQRRRVHTVQTCAEDRRFHGSGAVLRGRHARRCATTGAGVQSVQASLEYHSCRALAVGTAAVERGGRQLQLFPGQV